VSWIFDSSRSTKSLLVTSLVKSFFIHIKNSSKTKSQFYTYHIFFLLSETSQTRFLLGSRTPW
jgi:hypothetical protein